MTTDEFRHLALSFPETEERAHMHHPDFRVNGKVFATLGASGPDRGRVRLSPELQKTYVHSHPKIFAPVPGAWGRQGCTIVHLTHATENALRSAMGEAWLLASQAKPTRAKRKS